MSLVLLVILHPLFLCFIFNDEYVNITIFSIKEIYNPRQLHQDNTIELRLFLCLAKMHTAYRKEENDMITYNMSRQTT
jgi:hypothetical protein